MFTSLIEGLKAYLSSITLLEWFLTILDIVIVSFLVYYTFILVKGTRASRIVLGLAVLIVILSLGRLLQLKTLNWILSHLTTMVIVAIPIVFQPELRRALERLGRTKLWIRYLLPSQRKRLWEIHEIIQAAKILAKNKIGGLIVIQRQTGLEEYVEAGTKLDASLSSKLLLSIFFPNSPLHDGAVVLKNGKVVAAACTLPLSETESNLVYGTRHRAALGISEITDAVAIVISEEKGIISLVSEGKIEEGITLELLEKKLYQLISR